ncbi:MAG TPA: MFS transporter [Thermoleophilaceae bacterium]|nr:MFS transporter [Thermoleophilaceae bacterium]
MRRLIVLVSAIVLLDTAFYAAVAPLLPQYVDDLGLSKTAAGILTGSYAAGCFVGAIPAGWLAARVGVKTTTIAGLIGLAVASLVFGFAREVWLLDAARFAQGLASSCTWAAGFAWVVERAPADRRGEVIGAPLAAAIAGALVGPVLGTAAAELSPEAVFAGVAVGAIALAIPAWREPSSPGGEADMRRVGSALSAPGIRMGIWLVALPALAAGVMNVLVPLRLDALGAAGVAIGGTYLVAAAFEAVISPVVGRISDRRGRLVPIRFGLVAVAVLLVALPIPDSAVVVAILFVLTAIAAGAFWAPAMALLSDQVERVGVAQGFAFAFTNIAWAGGQLVGNGGGGALAEATADWVSYAVVTVLFIGTLATVARPRRRAQPQPA